MNITRLTLLSIAAALALSGCGNKGPLVLPDAAEDAGVPVAEEEADTAADQADEAAVDDALTDDAPTDGGETPDDADAPIDPEPLPQDDGDSD